MHKIFATAIFGAVLAGTQTQAQTQPTAAELLQKGIFAEETAGDLDGAIKIYHQIVDSHPAQREIAAQAQYRLGLTLLAKGDAASASQEIQRLGWDFPDYKDLIASAKSANGAVHAPITFTFSGPTTPEARKALEQKMAAAEDLAKLAALSANHDAEFDFTRSVTVTGTVKQIQFINPISWLTVNPPTDGVPEYRISLASPNSLMQAGWQRATVKLGDQVVVTGAPALDGSSIMQATSVSANGVVVFTRSATASK